MKMESPLHSGLSPSPTLVCHGFDEEPDDEVSEVPPRVICETPAICFKCKHCGINFPDRKKHVNHEKLCDGFHKISTKPSLSSPSSNVHSKKKIVCKFCSLSLASKSSRSRHEKACQANKNSVVSSPLFKCQHCGSTSNRVDNFKTHVKKCETKLSALGRRLPEQAAHLKGNASKSTAASTDFQNLGSSCAAPSQERKKSPCLFPDCEMEFYFKTSLIEHLKTSHNADIKDPVEIEFDSIEKFNKWKSQEQERTFSFFTAKRGQKAARVKYFYCQHDGCRTNPARKTGRLNKKGTIKVGHYCIAKMDVWKEAENVIKVVYWPTHSHNLNPEDLRHHSLPEEDSMFINEKLSWAVSPSKIYDFVRSARVPAGASRDDLKKNLTATILTKKLIRERARKVREKQRLYRDDAKSLFHLAHQLSEKEECVLVYKPYKAPVEIGPKEIDTLPNSDELFMFGMQSKRQAELMKEYSNKIVVVDETHGTNSYKYQLLNVLIVDDNKRGWPVAHLITSCSDANTLQYFFKAINLKLPGLDIGCVITDDDPALINSMELGFRKPLTHILCKWHVMKKFKEQVKKKFSKASQEEQTIMMNELKLLMNATDEQEFQNLLQCFKIKYEKEKNSSEFINYFKKHYADRTFKWAMCYRNFPHGNVNTTGHVESFHNKLKKMYLKRKVNKRLDDLVNLLRKIEKDDFEMRCQQENTGLSYIPQEILHRHFLGMTFLDDNFIRTSIDENTWEVQGSSEKSVYLIVRYYKKCEFDRCLSKCPELSCLQLCSHMFCCSCKDDHPLCKHIHKLQSYLCKDLVKTGRDNSVHVHVDDNVGPEESNGGESSLEGRTNEPLCESENICSSSGITPRTNMICKSLQDSISFFQSLMESPDENSMALAHAEKVCQDLVLRLKSFKKTISLPAMIPLKKFAPNEKLKTQISQLSSFKRPQGKRKRDSETLSPGKKRAMVTNLMSYLDENNDDVNMDSSSNVMNFTPSFNYSSNPCDIILRYGSIRISLLHLKSLELQLLGEEAKACKRFDPIFKVGWLYSSVIDAFMWKLMKKYASCVFFPTHLAMQSSNGYSNVKAIQDRLSGLDDCKALLFPANISGSHWVIVAVVFLDGGPELRYYDPLQHGTTAIVTRLLVHLTNDMKIIFPSHSWDNIILVVVNQQKDPVNCGVFICSYAEQIAQDHKQENYVTQNIPSYRKHMYNIIVGGCLKRNSQEDDSCGVCYEQYSAGTSDENEWVCCECCEQGFHVSCTAAAVLSQDSFICPS